MLEFTTAGGYERAILPEQIVEIHELPYNMRSATLIITKHGTEIYVTESYAEVMDEYKEATEEMSK